jgi:hypothetical protein
MFSSCRYVPLKFFKIERIYVFSLFYMHSCKQQQIYLFGLFYMHGCKQQQIYVFSLFYVRICTAVSNNRFMYLACFMCTAVNNNRFMCVACFICTAVNNYSVTVKSHISIQIQIFLCPIVGRQRPKHVAVSAHDFILSYLFTLQLLERMCGKTVRISVVRQAHR